VRLRDEVQIRAGRIYSVTYGIEDGKPVAVAQWFDHAAGPDEVQYEESDLSDCFADYDDARREAERRLSD